MHTSISITSGSLIRTCSIKNSLSVSVCIRVLEVSFQHANLTANWQNNVRWEIVPLPSAVNFLGLSPAHFDQDTSQVAQIVRACTIQDDGSQCHLTEAGKRQVKAKELFPPNTCFLLELKSICPPSLCPKKSREHKAKQSFQQESFRDDARSDNHLNRESTCLSENHLSNLPRVAITDCKSADSLHLFTKGDKITFPERQVPQ